MELTKILAAAINHGPRFVGGMVNIPRDIAEMADRAAGNMGSFLADLEEAFPVEFAAAIGE